MLSKYMSRKCVPYTPVTSKLAEMTVALVSSTGVYLEGQEPYNEPGDETYRVIPPDTPDEQLRFKHPHYDVTNAQRDPSSVFPLARLRELAAEGFIKRVSNKHIGCKGFSPDLKAQYERMAPAIASEIERSQADAVVLTGGCPACHRVIGVVQREIEARGIPTVMITVSPDDTRAMRPPRAVHPVGHALGRVLGAAGERDRQMRVLTEALRQFEFQHVPGTIVEFEP
jgi:D-proline reductase (dithiol) PrdB